MPGVFSSVRSKVGRRVPSPPAALSRPGGQGRPALPALERFCPFPEVSHPHGRAEARPSRSLSTGRDALLRVRGRNGCATMESSGEKPVVSFVQSRGRAASPLAAGNRDVQVDVMGGADASRPESGERCVRTFPATPFGMTGSGGQGLPALPHPCTWEIARFSPGNSKGREKETPVFPDGPAGVARPFADTANRSVPARKRPHCFLNRPSLVGRALRASRSPRPPTAKPPRRGAAGRSERPTSRGLRRPPCGRGGPAWRPASRASARSRSAAPSSSRW